MCCRVGGGDVVGIVGGQQGGADLLRDRNQIGEDPPLGFDSMIAQLNEEVIPAEYVLIHGGGCDRTVEVSTCLSVSFLARRVRREEARNVTAETPRRGNDAFRVLAE